MKAENQIWAGFHLLVHALFIGLGIGVAYFAPYESRLPSKSFEVSTFSLLNESLSVEQLKSWSEFFDSDHDWVNLGVDELEQFIASNKNVASLDFFAGVDRSGKAQLLADRISIIPDPDVDQENCLTWEVSVSGASTNDAAYILNALVSFLDERLQEHIACYGASVDTSLNRSSVEDPRTSDQLEPTFPPGIAVLVASFCVVAIWSFWVPGSSRTVSITQSVSQFAAVVVCFAGIGAVIGYVADAFEHKQWESTCSVEVVDKPLASQSLMAADKRELVQRILEQKPSGRFTTLFEHEDTLQMLVLDKQMFTWNCFRSLIETEEELEAGASGRIMKSLDENVSTIVEFIKTRLEVNVDPTAEEIVNIKFRCKDGNDAKSFLACLVGHLKQKLENNNDRTRELAIAGVPMAIETTEINWLSIPKSKKVRWPEFNSRSVINGLNLGAIAALILLSSIRVLAGVPPL